MTAEIAILNKSAVAMAADSAVTFGPKIYNSVNKLFTLSKYQPVGIMIYNDAKLMEVPLEIIIKQFREQLGEDAEENLFDYADRFISFLENCDIFDTDTEEEAYDLVIRRHLGDIRSIISQRIDDYIKSRGLDDLTNAEGIKIVREEIENFYKSWQNVGYREGFSEDDLEQFIDRFEDIYKTNIDHYFKPFVEEGSEAEEKLIEICAFLYLKKEFANNYSGIVIAGYGTEDLYPKIVSYKMSFSVDRNLKFIKKNHKQVSTQIPSTIYPFAQSQISDLFIYNIHPEIANFQRGYISQMPSKVSEILDEKLTQGEFGEEVGRIKNEINDEVQNIFTKFDHELIEYLRENHVNPLYSAVSVLPKDKLATLAESLVNLTSFKQKMSMDSETVGGPIDVAVISKGDGFIWIDRKHYFEKELNHGFFENYFK